MQTFDKHVSEAHELWPWLVALLTAFAFSHLGGNGLEGTISSQLAQLSQLQVLYVRLTFVCAFTNTPAQQARGQQTVWHIPT